MNGQHKGAEAQMLLQFEATYRTPPGAPAAWRIPFVKCGLTRDLRRTTDDSLDNSPLAAKTGYGDAVVPPAGIDTIFDARLIGIWLKLVLGQPLVKKAVTKQPTLVTGVTAHYAGSAAGAGNGTLTYTQIGTTLAWTPNGGVAGAAQNVSAGGRFTLAGGAANQELVIDVTAGSLPVANAADADIAVHATLKAHVFPCTLDDRNSALVELGHMKAAQQEFYRYLGYLTSKISWSVHNRDQNMTVTGFAAEERSADTTPAVAAVWDAAPTAYDRLRFSGAFGQITNGLNLGFGTIVESDFNIDNQATGLEVMDGLEGYGHADNGEVKFEGTAKLVFRGLQAGNLWSLARSSTSNRMRVVSKVPNGADTFTLAVDMPSVEFAPTSKEVSGKTGLFVSVKWMAHRNIAGSLPMIVLVNDVPAY